MRARRTCRVRARIDSRPHRRGPQARERARRPHGATAEAHHAPEARCVEGSCRRHGVASRSCPPVQRQSGDDFEAGLVRRPAARRNKKLCHQTDWSKLSFSSSCRRCSGVIFFRWCVCQMLTKTIRTIQIANEPPIIDS